MQKRSKHLSGTAADEQRKAIEFMVESGKQLCAISINWALFNGIGISDDIRLARAQERLRHRLQRRGYELAWCWVREVSKGGAGAPNTQLTAYNPFPTTDEFAALLAECFEPVGGPNDAAIKVKFAGGPIGWWRYSCKGISREDGKAEHRKIKPEYQGEIDGKRSGMTQNLNRAARRRARATLPVATAKAA